MGRRYQSRRTIVTPFYSERENPNLTARDADPRAEESSPRTERR
jgi:hypothetical protein